MNALALHAGVVALALSAPVFAHLLENRRYLPLAPSSVLLVIAAFWAAPVLLLAGLDAIISTGRAGERARGAVRVAAITACLLAIAQQAGFSLRAGRPVERPVLEAAALAAAAVLLVALVARTRARVEPFFRLAGAVSVGLAAWFFWASAAPARTPTGAPASIGLAGTFRGGPVLILVFDGLSGEALVDSAGRISARFPNLRRLADDGLWVREATTDYDHTASSIPSMLSGRLGFKQTFGETNLFDLLAPAREEIDGVVLNYCDRLPRRPGGTCRDGRTHYTRRPGALLSHVARAWLPRVLPRLLWARPPDDGKADAKEATLLFVEKFLRGLRTEPLDGALLFHHVFSPHTPFVVEGDGRRRARADGIQGFYDARAPAEIEVAYERYLREIDFVDSVVGRVVGTLRDRGAWDSATLVVTADHGNCWEWDHRRWGLPGEEEYVNDQIARVPLLLKPPAAAGPVEARGAYRHVDLVPTLLDLLGVPPPADPPLDGRSILRPGPDRGPPRVGTSLHRSWTYDSAAGRWRMEEEG